MSNQHSASAGAAARQISVRPARVWQAIDLLHPRSPSNGFTSSPWGLTPAPFFDPTDFASLDLGQSKAPEHGLGKGDPTTDEVAPDLAEMAAAAARAAVNTDALAQARAEGHALGVAETRAALQDEMQNTLQERLASDQSLLQSMQSALSILQQSPNTYFEPLKRLALHLAEQLVLAELSTDGKAIDRLVQACLDELAQQDESMILLELHSSDLAQWQSLRERTGLNKGAGLRLQANDALIPGSVRARANDTLVEDLIVERLAGLATTLGFDGPHWRANSAFNHDRVASERPIAARLTQRPVEPLEQTTLDSIPDLDAKNFHGVVDAD